MSVSDRDRAGAFEAFSAIVILSEVSTTAAIVDQRRPHRNRN
jgi:hypothetical protein